MGRAPSSPQDLASFLFPVCPLAQEPLPGLCYCPKAILEVAKWALTFNSCPASLNSCFSGQQTQSWGCCYNL